MLEENSLKLSSNIEVTCLIPARSFACHFKNLFIFSFGFIYPWLFIASIRFIIASYSGIKLQQMIVIFVTFQL